MSSSSPVSSHGDMAARPPLEGLFEQTTHQWHGYIADKADFITTRHDIFRLRRVDKDRSQDMDFDYPMTPQDERQLVHVLYEAMCDFSDPFEERNGKTSFQVERLKTVPDIQMEMLALEVLVASWLLRTYTRDALKYQSFASFGARFRAVVNACREHKSIVYNIIAPCPVQRLASHPLTQIGKTNAKINRGRTEEKRKGKEALEMLGQAAGNGVISGRVVKKQKEAKADKTVPQPLSMHSVVWHKGAFCC